MLFSGTLVSTTNLLQDAERPGRHDRNEVPLLRLPRSALIEPTQVFLRSPRFILGASSKINFGLLTRWSPRFILDISSKMDLCIRMSALRGNEKKYWLI